MSNIFKISFDVELTDIEQNQLTLYSELRGFGIEDAISGILEREGKDAIVSAKDAAQGGDLPYVMVVHEPSQRAYTLHRGYCVLEEDLDKDQISAYRIMALPHETEVGWRTFARPDWADKLDLEAFTAYWLW